MSISAKVVADSISNGVRITTLELNYHRFIHSEFMTHRMFSRNASSSRAIPVEKMLEQVRDNPAMPIYWGANIPGMQAKAQIPNISLAKYIWEEAAESASHCAYGLHEDCELHKQLTNRLLEPFQYIKVIVTATEWANFFKLRLHKDAQPEMQELARCMKEAMEGSVPVELRLGQWHLPYITVSELDNPAILTKDLLSCSVARCARVSYNNHDNSSPAIDKDIALAYRLLEAGHMSPFEHQATKIKYPRTYAHTRDWQVGVTHVDMNNDSWSSNFRGWIQYRNLL